MAVVAGLIAIEKLVPSRRTRSTGRGVLLVLACAPARRAGRPPGADDPRSSPAGPDGADGHVTRDGNLPARNTMTQTQYYTATTLDGFIADADNSLDWLLTRAAGRRRDARTTARSSPTSARSRWARRPTSGSSTTSSTGRIRRTGRGRTTCPAGSSRTATCRSFPGARSSSRSGDVAPVHAEAGHAAGDRNIWVVGGGDLAGQFADAGLLDEVLVSIAPVTLGCGRAAAAAPSGPPARGDGPQRRLRLRPLHRGALRPRRRSENVCSAGAGVSRRPRPSPDAP